MNEKKVSEYASIIPLEIRNITRALSKPENFALYISIVDAYGERPVYADRLKKEFKADGRGISNRLRSLAGVGLIMPSPDRTDDMEDCKIQYYPSEMGLEFFESLFNIFTPRFPIEKSSYQ
jgi:hypothetical protein